jgi:glyoxylase-like metal-dependent hydrolase (beta-lactamase superfamily II)
MSEGNCPEIRQVTVGPYGVNSYVLVCPETNESLIIDPADEADKILELAEGTKVKEILFTHAHFDHIQAYDAVKKATGAPSAIHPGDVGMLGSRPDRELSDGEVIRCGNFNVKVIHTPGHTDGGVSFLLDGDMIVGDNVFPGGPGKTASPEAFQTLVASIESKIYTLPDETRLHPGHGDGTTVGESKAEYEVFRSKPRDKTPYGDVLWLET